MLHTCFVTLAIVIDFRPINISFMSISGNMVMRGSNLTCARIAL